MSPHHSVLYGYFAFVLLFATQAVNASAQAVEKNLLQLSEVCESGTYTYYARGDASRKNITPFTRLFYPGGGDGVKPQGLHASITSGPSVRDGSLIDAGDNAAPVPIRTGELTDANKTGPVSGWINVLSRSEVSESGANTGQFDLLFDLGTEYCITKIILHVRDQGGHRWIGEQECYTAESFANPTNPVDNDFRLFGSASIPKEQSSAVEFVATPRNARYVNFRFLTSVSRYPGATASVGGILYEVEIHGAKL